MGGLKSYLPSTYMTFLIATIAIAGIPPLAGFFSKDEIVAMVFNAGANYSPIYFGLFALAMLTAFMTAFYMFRLTFGTFHGTFKLPLVHKEAAGAEKYLHESPWQMTLPLWVLAGLSIVGGFMGFPDFVVQTFAGPDAHSNWLHGWLIPYVSEAELTLAKSIKWGILLGSIALASTAVYIAYLKYGRDNVASSDEALKAGFGPAYKLWSDKYNLDEIYEGYIANPILRLSDKVLAVFDIKVIDGLVNLTAGVVSFSGSLIRYVQTGIVSTYAVYFVIGALLVAGILLF